ncbi:MAG TPA: head GIN domain-containing protein [Ramlibacter sp.]
MTAATFRRHALLALASLSFIAAPAFAETVRGDGVMKSETRPVSGFTSIGLALGAKVEVKLGNTEGLTIQADENLLPLIETSVKHGALEIRPVRDHLSLSSNDIRIVVQAKAIDGLAIGGSGSITADALRAAKVKLDIGGSGSIDVKRLDADRVEVSIGGSGDVKLAGTAKKFDASIAGSGDVVTPNLVADEAAVTVAGSGATKIAVRSRLDVTIVGAGAVGYYGDPQVSRTVLGSGAIKRLGALPL